MLLDFGRDVSCFLMDFRKIITFDEKRNLEKMFQQNCLNDNPRAFAKIFLADNMIAQNCLHKWKCTWLCESLAAVGGRDDFVIV